MSASLRFGWTVERNFKPPRAALRLQTETMASDNRVKASVVLKNLTLDGQMDWKIENFVATLEVRKEVESPDFKFFFPQVNKTFTFALKVSQNLFFENFEMALLNRNPEDVGMSADLNVGSLTGSFISEVAKGQAQCWNLYPTLDQFVASSSAGSLNMSVKFSIFNYLKSATVGQLDLADPNQSLYESQRKLWADGVLSDFTIECGSETFFCHKNILANRCDVFDRLFASQDCNENKKNLFQIKDHQPNVVKQMLEFIYTNRIPDGTQCSLELLLIAGQFNLKGLVQLCESEITKEVTCQNVIQILRVVDKVVDAKHLKDFASDFLANNMSSIVKTSDWKQIVASPKFLDAIEDFTLKK